MFYDLLPTHWRKSLKNPLNDIMCWWYDEFVREWITLYYWPYFVAGNIDDWMSMGITLNGVKSSSICKIA